MEFGEVLSRRKMTRRFTEEAVSPDVIERITAAARRAPSAGGAEGRSFRVATDPVLRREIARRAGEPDYVRRGFEPWLSRAPVHIAPCVSPAAYLERYRRPDKQGSALSGLEEGEWPVPYWWVDIGASLQNLLLAAVDEGLAAGFLGAHAIPGLAELLNLLPGCLPIGVATIGRPAP